MPDPVARSDTWTWRGPVDGSSSVQLSRVLNDVPPRESTISGSNVCEWTDSPNSSSREYGSDLDDAITMSLSECSSGEGGSGGCRGTGGGLARGDARSPFSPRITVPRSGAGRLNSVKAPPYRRGGSTTIPSSTWAPFCGSVCVKGTAFLDQHEVAPTVVQQSERLRPWETNSPSKHSRPRQGQRSSLPAPQLSQFFPDYGNSSNSSSDDVLERTQAGIWDDAAKTIGAAQKRQSEGRRGSIDSCDMYPSRQSPRGLLAKAPCAAIGILRGRDERRRRQLQRREQQKLRQVDPDLGRSDSDQEQAWSYRARCARSIRHTSSESLGISPGSSPTLLSPLNRKAHAFETLRSACLSADTSANANDDRLLEQENDGSEGSARGISTTSYFPSTIISSTGELLRHHTVTRGSSAERLPEDGLQRADPSAPHNLLLSPVGNVVPGKESPVSTIAGSRWGIRIMVATDHRAATVAAAAAERQSLVECSDLNPTGADSLGSVVDFGSIGLRLRDDVVAVSREPTVVDPAAASTVDDISHGSVVTIAAPPSISSSSPPPSPPHLRPFHRSKHNVHLSCYGPSSFQRLSLPIWAGVASTNAVAETNAELAPLRHVGGGGGSGGGSGIEKREREPKGGTTRPSDTDRGFGYRCDHEYDVFREKWSPRGGGGRGEVGRGGKGQKRGGKGGGGGASTSGARYSHRRCGTVKGPGRPKSIWPSSPTSSQQLKAQSGPCHRRGMIWDNDDHGTSVIWLGAVDIVALMAYVV